MYIGSRKKRKENLGETVTYWKKTNHMDFQRESPDLSCSPHITLLLRIIHCKGSTWYYMSECRPTNVMVWLPVCGTTDQHVILAGGTCGKYQHCYISTSIIQSKTFSTSFTKVFICRHFVKKTPQYLLSFNVAIFLVCPLQKMRIFVFYNPSGLSGTVKYMDNIYLLRSLSGKT